VRARPRLFREIFRAAGILGLPQRFAAAGPENRPQNFKLWQKNPSLKSLGFKKIKPDLWSVRAGSGFRALATFEDGRHLWFWIGAHDEYERLIRNF
jgi:hypothetical protein